VDDFRLLIAATSGQGKSWALRRILEQTHGFVQQIIFDPEGEFFTLREIFDFILARAGEENRRDCPADVASADVLAKKLLEKKASAVLDIYELQADQRTEFVRVFVECLMDVPRTLWRPVMVVIDEAQLFVPQSGESASGKAVSDMMFRGRKRGFSGVLSSLRLSAVHKDAIAMCRNILIGGFTLDVDTQRAVNSLGFVGREAESRIRQLAPGNFFVQGPAFTREVELATIGGVQTTHPKSGRKLPPVAPPSAHIKTLLPDFQNLYEEAKRKLRTEADLKQEIKILRAQVARLRRQTHVVPELQPTDVQEEIAV